jgi:demethylmenaquinone methyltransferase / 2-methoxy-6-polyprenyl-1,4-benzoquinol methylase
MLNKSDRLNLPVEPEKKARAVKEMFARIAHRYDLMNRIMTAGQDVRWRKHVIRLSRLPLRGRLLDLGAGTGDLAFEAALRQPGSRLVAADFTIEMMRVGHSRALQYNPRRNISWTAADALLLPFADSSFDAVVSGFLMRNVTSVEQALQEQVRVLKPGGRLVILDTTRPRSSLFKPLIDLHLKVLIPSLGGWITGDKEAYRYLPETTASFLTAEQLAARMGAAGLRELGFQVMMFGTTAIHWGVKWTEE